MMTNSNVPHLTKDEFLAYLRFFAKQASIEDDMLYALYTDAVNLLALHHETFKDLPTKPLDQGRLILYLLFDYEFRMNKLAPQDRLLALEEDALYSRIVNMVVDKYGSMSYFKYDEGRLVTPYSMEISTIDVYTNFILLRITSLGEGQHEKLFIELLRNAFSLCRTITGLLVDGFEKEALSVWRSLHELEAVLVLIKDQKVQMAYEEHIVYHAAFNNLLHKEEGDRVFVKIKEELRKYNLKSKDTKRYIEYGWITHHPAFDETLHKFNFRDGVQSLAGLEEARGVFQSASEVTHGSPLVLFSQRPQTLNLTLSALYRSFLTIEALFAALYERKGPANEVDIYLVIRQYYLEEINTVADHISKQR